MTERPAEPILHVDMDSFFASVEVRDDPALRGRPVVVGGSGPHAVVAAASYPARTWGVHSAMAMSVARRRCPELVVVTPRMSHYRAVSRQVMEILHDVTPLVRQISVDEAFLDVSGAVRQFGAPIEMAQRIKRRVRDELGLACSVGVARSPSVAKIASTRSKPDGLLLVRADETRSFLAPLPVGVIWGVGAVARGRLEHLGIRTVGDLATAPDGVVDRVFGTAAPGIRAIARGEDRAALTPRESEKSVGHEETYGEHLTSSEQVHARLVDLCDRTARSLRSAGAVCRVMTLKVRYETGETLTRSHTFTGPVDSAETLRRRADSLMERAGGVKAPVRLLGVRAERLASASVMPVQPELGRGAGWSQLEVVMDSALSRFGQAGLRRASTLAGEKGDDIPNPPQTPYPGG